MPVHVIVDIMPHTCSQCERTFSQRRSLLRHMREKHGEGAATFTCPECEQSFGRAGDLARHQQNLHGGVQVERKPYYYKHCDRTFKRRDNYLRHDESHETGRVYTCQDCQRCFKRVEHLREHLITQHTTVRPSYLYIEDRCKNKMSIVLAQVRAQNFGKKKS